MHVRQINCRDPRQVSQFIDVPFRLYKQQSLWAPPLIADAKLELNPDKHPFYQHSEAAFFVAEDDSGKLLGRIGVMNNRNYNQYAGKKAAFWGFFESENDVVLAYRLFKAAFSWARQRGLTELIGPKTLISTDANGILVDGFEHPPALSVPYNFPYYDRLIKAAGFEKETDFLSGYLPADTKLPERLHRIAQRALRKGGYQVKVFSSKKEMREWVPRIISIYNESFVDALGFYPVSEAETWVVAKTILSVAEPGLIKVILKDGQPIGFLLAYRNINEGLRQAKGSLVPFGWYHLLRAWRKTEMLDINGVGIMPGHQGVGANAVLYTELENSVHSVNFKFGDIVLVDEKNYRSFSDMESMGVRWYKRHRRYSRRL